MASFLAVRFPSPSSYACGLSGAASSCIPHSPEHQLGHPVSAADTTGYKQTHDVQQMCGFIPCCLKLGWERTHWKTKFKIGQWKNGGDKYRLDICRACSASGKYTHFLTVSTFRKKEWEKLPRNGCARLVESYSRLEAVIAAKRVLQPSIEQRLWNPMYMYYYAAVLLLTGEVTCISICHGELTLVHCFSLFFFFCLPISHFLRPSV